MLSKVKYLIAQGADPATDCPIGWLILQNKWDTNIAHLLVKHGADVNHPLPGVGNGLPLQKAVITSNVNAVRFLIENGAEQNQPHDIMYFQRDPETAKYINKTTNSSAVDLLRLGAGWTKPSLPSDREEIANLLNVF